MTTGKCLHWSASTVARRSGAKRIHGRLGAYFRRSLGVMRSIGSMEDTVTENKEVDDGRGEGNRERDSQRRHIQGPRKQGRRDSGCSVLERHNQRIATYLLANTKLERRRIHPYKQPLQSEMCEYASRVAADQRDLNGNAQDAAKRRRHEDVYEIDHHARKHVAKTLAGDLRIAKSA